MGLGTWENIQNSECNLKKKKKTGRGMSASFPSFPEKDGRGLSTVTREFV